MAEKTFKVLEHVSTQLGLGGNKKSILQREGEAKARRKAARERVKARQRIKEMPDEKTMKVAARKAVARKRAARSGRASTILSSNETLG